MGRVTACSAASLQANSWAYATVRATKARDLSARRKTPRNTAAFSRGFIRLGGVSGDVRRRVGARACDGSIACHDATAVRTAAP
jgi:hypothetical protein